MAIRIADAGSRSGSNEAERTWVTEVLDGDELKLSSSRVEPFGRARLGPFSKFLLWSMRAYVLLSFVLIAAQIYISLRK